MDNDWQWAIGPFLVAAGAAITKGIDVLWSGTRSKTKAEIDQLMQATYGAALDDFHEQMERMRVEHHRELEGLHTELESLRIEVAILRTRLREHETGDE